MRLGMIVLLSLAACVAASGCNQLSDQISEQEGLRADAGVKAANADLEVKSKAMEAYLATQQRFHQGSSGRFASDTVSSESGNNWQFHLEVVATVPPYRGTRTRALEEVIADINALQLNIRYSQLDPATHAKAGCLFTGVRPNTDSGRIDLVDPSCPASITLWLLPAAGGVHTSPGSAVAAGSSQIAQAIKDGHLDEADVFLVEVDNSHSAEILNFTVKRTERFNW